MRGSRRLQVRLVSAFLGTATAVLLAFGFGLGTASHALADGTVDEIVIGGTGAILGTMRTLGEAFRSQEPDVSVEVLPSLGSTGGIRALDDGAIDIAVAARPLRGEEEDDHLLSYFFARSPFMLFSSHPNPDGIEPDALAQMYADPGARWSDGTPVRLILRPENDSGMTYLETFFPGILGAIEAARDRPDVPVALTAQDNLAMAQRVAGSLTAATLTQVITEEAMLNPMSISGITPAVATLEHGAYPLEKRFFLVVVLPVGDVVERFLTFVESPRGREILRRTGNIPVRHVD